MITNVEFVTKKSFNTKYVAKIIIIIYKSKRRTQGLTQYNEILKPECHLKTYHYKNLVII